MRARFAVALAALLATASAPVPRQVIAGDGVVPDAAEAAKDADAAVLPRAPASVHATLRLPPFAPSLSSRPVIASPGGWHMAGQSAGWAGLIAARPATRQAARWAYATNQVLLGRAAEAIAALDVMRQDEPDLSLVPSYQLALGATLTLLNRPSVAVAALTNDVLSRNPEACAWRMLALAQANLPDQVLAELRCALPALNARPAATRAPFALAVARAAADLGRPALAVELLKTLPTTNIAANLMRGRAALALGRTSQGHALLAGAKAAGDRAQAIDADLSMLEDSARRGVLTRSASDRLGQIRFVWRGGDIEVRALRLAYKVARRNHDLRGTLEAGATLFRYFSGGADRSTLVAELQQTLMAALAADNPMPLDQVAGLYWDYRDLSPAAAAGDFMVFQLADRLQSAGLYERAAELLDHQLRVRTKDIAQGPLSARVASLFILAAKPSRALAAIRDTDANAYPDEMLWDRHRVEAVALDQLGQTDEALAALQDVPDGGAIRGEIYWKHRDWKALAATAVPAPAGSTPMTEVVQARILRYAIALAMLGRENDLALLRSRYGAAFARLPTAGAFEALTAAVGAIDPATMSAAMAAIPSASPAGGIADLIDAAPRVASKTD
ncbi:hypothetical protein U1839_06890 [Sphingomonas sp. RT2P30]|uniref:hypothetical protein n=1 Tax=Parasphingomonas halimpatiens TaxID=3096162 RepID=UPI002FC64B6C